MVPDCGSIIPMSAADHSLTCILSFVNLHVELLVEILSRWLDLRSLVNLDSAACNQNIRAILRELFASSHCVFASDLAMEDYRVVAWFRARKLQVYSVTLSVSFPELTRYFRSHAGSIRHVRCTAFETLRLVAIYVHNLKALSYQRSFAVPELSDVLWLNSNLQVLRLESLRDLSAEHFGELSLPHLSLLSLWITPCDDEVLGKIVGATESLQKIDIGVCKEVTDTGVITAAEHCPQLRSLGLSALPISDGALL